MSGFKVKEKCLKNQRLGKQGKRYEVQTALYPFFFYSLKWLGKYHKEMNHQERELFYSKYK